MRFPESYLCNKRHSSWQCENKGLDLLTSHSVKVSPHNLKPFCFGSQMFLICTIAYKLPSKMQPTTASEEIRIFINSNSTDHPASLLEDINGTDKC